MITLHPSNTRGLTQNNWLVSKHSFSFGAYYDPLREKFGFLRVLNDDVVAPEKGFGMHFHENMEIVTIVLKGVLEHQDSLGNQGLIKAGDVQRMSAGSGIRHSEYNPSSQESVHFLQIWVLPDQEGLPPSYEQKNLSSFGKHEGILPIVSDRKYPGTLLIH